jgi:hypothetical protein
MFHMYEYRKLNSKNSIKLKLNIMFIILLTDLNVLLLKVWLIQPYLHYLIIIN